MKFAIDPVNERVWLSGDAAPPRCTLPRNSRCSVVSKYPLSDLFDVRQHCYVAVNYSDVNPPAKYVAYPDRPWKDMLPSAIILNQHFG